MAELLVIPKSMQPGQDPMAQPAQQPAGTIVVPKASQPVAAPKPATQPKGVMGKAKAVASKVGIGEAGSPEAEAFNFPPKLVPIVNGFNQRFLDQYGIPLDQMNRIWTDLGNEGFLDSDETGTEALTRKLNEIGIPAKAVQTEAERMGAQLFENLTVALVTLGAGLGINATIQTTGPAQSVVGGAAQHVLQTAANHPGQLLLSEAGSAVGQHTIGPALEPTIGQGPAEMVGAMAGGMLPDTITAKALARLAGGTAFGTAGFVASSTTGNPILMGVGTSVMAMRGARAGRNMMDRMLSDRFQYNKAFSTMDTPNEATEYAKYAIEGDILAADTAITRAVQNVGGIADPTRRAEKLHNLVDGMYKRSQVNASKLWDKVDQSRAITPAIPQLKEFADYMRATAGEFNEGIPDHFLGMIDEIAANAGSGKPIDTRRTIEGDVELVYDTGKKVFTIKDVRNIQSSISGMLRKGVDNPTLERNLVQLRTALDDAVQMVYPQDGTLAAAREYTNWVHDTFSRGALGYFYGHGAPKGQFLTGPQAKALELLKSERGGGQLADAARQLRAKKVEAGLTQFIASEFQQRANDLGPKAGLKFLEAPATKHFMVNFPREAARMEGVAVDLKTALDNRAAIDKSYFHRFSGMDPQSAAINVMSGPKKVQNMEALVARLEQDESGHAIEGLRGAMIKHVMQVVNGDPVRFKNQLADKDMRAVFNVAFGNKMPRLDELLDNLAKYGGNKGDLATAKVDEATGSVSGAVLGRQIPGSGLIGPSAGSNIARWATKQLFGRIPVNELIHLALQDPKWEAYVKAKVPSNLTEMRAATDEMTRLLAMSQGAIVALGGAEE